MNRILVYGLCESFGGTERYILTLYKALDHDKIQFDFLYDHACGEIPYEQEIISQGGHIYKEYYKNRDRNLPGAITAEELYKKHPEWNGVYVNWQSVDTAYRLIVAAKRAGLKYRVVHAHNNNYTHPVSKKEKLYELFFHLTKKMYVTHFLACSELAGRWAYKNILFTVIPNAVDFKKFQYNGRVREKMRTDYNLDDSIKVIGFCGRLVYQKNPQFLLQIFAEIYRKNSGVRLLLVGDGPLRNELEEQATGMEIRESVIFSGSVNNVEDYIQMMDCFLLPSRFEGFGIVLLEAQAVGLNCFTMKDVVPVATNLTGHVCFLDSKATAEKWAEKVLSVGFDHYDSMDLLLNSDYTIDKSVQKLMKIFE